MLCIRDNVSVNNESVRICRVLRASLNVLEFLYHSGSFHNRTTGYHNFPFVGVSDCFVCWTAYHEHVFLVFCQKRVLYTDIFKVWCLGNNLCGNTNDRRSGNGNLSTELQIHPKKKIFGTSTGFELMASTLALRCSSSGGREPQR